MVEEVEEVDLYLHYGRIIFPFYSIPFSHFYMLFLIYIYGLILSTI